jgi:predicted transcriptional regulator
MIALFSIKPEYVNKIFSGRKGYEYRKAIFKVRVKKVVVYCTKPVGMIVGEFDIDDILEGCPNTIWRQTSHSSGVRKEFYKEYFKGKSKGYAINIGQKTVYEKAVDPYEIFDSFTPPQSFQYLSAEDYSQCLTSASTQTP